MAMADRAAPADLDVLIQGGEVIDGSGGDAFVADVGVAGGGIAGIGDLGDYGAARTIDARGLYVIPGFIDMHTHSERGLPYPELAASVHHLKQGVATVVAGCDGYGAWPIHSSIDALTDRLATQGIGTNAGLMVGLGQVRRQVMGMEDREPTIVEMDRMKEMVREAMEGGAIGLSSGLIFTPDRLFDTEGIIALASVVVPYGGIYHTHIRDEADGLIDAVDETIRICESSGATTVVTHFKAVYRRNWGKLREATDAIERARARSVRVYADQYPFTEGGPVPLVPPAVWLGGDTVVEERAGRISRVLGGLSAGDLFDLHVEVSGAPADPDQRQFFESRPELLREAVAEALAKVAPVEGASLHAVSSWFGMQQGPGNPDERARFVARLADPRERAAVRTQVGEHIDGLGGADNVRLFGSRIDELELKTLVEAAESLGLSEVDAAIRLALEGARVVVTMHSEEDVEYAMRKDFVATGSDGDYPYYGPTGGYLSATQAIRAYSTYSTKIRRYVYERNVLSLPQAIRAGTSLPAEILGWEDRGLLKEGYLADVAVLDLDRLRPRSTLKDLHRYSEGVEYVLVNGSLALDRGEPAGELAGRVIGVGTG